MSPEQKKSLFEMHTRLTEMLTKRLPNLNRTKARELAKRAIIECSKAVENAPTSKQGHDRANKHMIASANREANPGGAACRAGCSSCCRSEYIEISANEAQTIKINFGKLPTPLQDQVKNNLEKKHSTANNGLGSPCAFLVDDKCSIHAFRPSTCWGYLSTDRAQCEGRLTNNGGSVEVLPYGLALRLAFTLFYPLSHIDDLHLAGAMFEMNSVMRDVLVNGKSITEMALRQTGRAIPSKLIN